MFALEKLGVFIYIFVLGVSNRDVGEHFQHSRDTISIAFHDILEAITTKGNGFHGLASDIIRPKDLRFPIPPQIMNDKRYMPYFKDCIGCIDGTHIGASSSTTLLQRIISSLHHDLPWFFELFFGYFVSCDDTERKLGVDGVIVFYPTLYKNLAGAFQYLTFTHLNLCYTLHQAVAEVLAAGVGILCLIDAVRITAAHVCVNAAQLELVLLRDFKENMLSCKDPFSLSGPSSGIRALRNSEQEE
ncbi:hypothetical protein Tco_0216303 [Tanacetum coccineum]